LSEATRPQASHHRHTGVVTRRASRTTRPRIHRPPSSSSHSGNRLCKDDRMAIRCAFGIAKGDIDCDSGIVATHIHFFSLRMARRHRPGSGICFAVAGKRLTDDRDIALGLALMSTNSKPVTCPTIPKRVVTDFRERQTRQSSSVPRSSVLLPEPSFPQPRRVRTAPAYRRSTLGGYLIAKGSGRRRSDPLIFSRSHSCSCELKVDLSWAAES